MSLSWYVMARSRNEPVIALPIFPLRMQIHPYIFCSPASGIERPEDLEGQENRHGPVPLDRRSVGAAASCKNITACGRKIASGLRQRTRVADAGYQPPADVNSRAPTSPPKRSFARRARRADPAQYRAVVSNEDPRIRRVFKDIRATVNDYFRQHPNLPDHSYSGRPAVAVRQTSLARSQPARTPSMKLKNFAGSPTTMPSARHFRRRF